MLPLIPVALVVWYLAGKNQRQPVRLLPYYNDKRVKSDTPHRVPPFAFTDQYREIVTDSAVAGKIYIAEFFFTTCRSICPVMNSNLDKIYNAFNDPRIRILSHTVDPETDSVPVLRAYADRHHVHDNRWLFLTGDKKALYHMARRGYLLGDAEPAPGEDDFVHTQNFALVDWNRRIRGIYDGTDSLEMIRLGQDIRLLTQELDANDTAH